MSVNRNENNNSESNVSQSKLTKEFLERLTPQSWLDEKRAFILSKFEEHLDWNSELKGEFTLQVGKLLKSAQGSEWPLSEKDAKIEVMEKVFGHLDAVENEDLKYGMYFEKDKPDELIKMFAKLEEENLALINAQTETQETINEEKTKFEDMMAKKEQQIEATVERKKSLEKALETLDLKVKVLKEMQNSKKTTNHDDPYEGIEMVVNQFLKEFKDEKELRYSELGLINKMELKNKENLLKYLKAIERLLIDQVTKLSESGQTEDIKRLRNEAARKKNKDEDRIRKQEEERLGNRLKKEKRLAELRRKKGRKDMFKYAFPDKQDEAEDNNNDEELLEFQKYFLD